MGHTDGGGSGLLRGEIPVVDLSGHDICHEQVVDVTAASAGRIRLVKVLRAALKQDRDPFSPPYAGSAARDEPRRRSPLRELVDHRLLQARHRATLLPSPRPATAARPDRSACPVPRAHRRTVVVAAVDDDDDARKGYCPCLKTISPPWQLPHLR